MRKSKNQFSDIFDSEQGIHISIFMPRPKSILQCKEQLREHLDTCQNQIGEEIPPTELDHLLRPIKNLFDNPQLLMSVKDHIGIFRSANMMRIVSVPTSTLPYCHIAETFHVKPLFEALNSDFDYIFFGSDNARGYLYVGNKNGYNLVEEYIYQTQERFMFDPDASSSGAKKVQFQQSKRVLKWVCDKIKEMDVEREHTLFLCAPAKHRKFLKSQLKDHDLYPMAISDRFNLKRETVAHKTIRDIMIIDTQINHNFLLSEIANVKDPSCVSYDLMEISQAARHGYVERLIVASDVKIFGRVDFAKSLIYVHDKDTDHTDDDILDDIAQKVHATRGDVLVVPRDLIPNNHPVVAVIQWPSTLDKMGPDVIEDHL
ncbi:MAG: hypothetical protein K2Q26_01770 [Bdellovibrionales bacterium]|nr:hypothetical protein [Bdellovibrionales bacterium]